MDEEFSWCPNLHLEIKDRRQEFEKELEFLMVPSCKFYINLLYYV